MILALSVGVEAKPITEQEAKTVALNFVESMISDVSKTKSINLNKAENVTSNGLLEASPHEKKDIKDIRSKKC